MGAELVVGAEWLVPAEVDGCGAAELEVTSADADGSSDADGVVEIDTAALVPGVAESISGIE